MLKYTGRSTKIYTLAMYPELKYFSGVHKSKFCFFLHYLQGYKGNNFIFSKCLMVFPKNWDIKRPIKKLFGVLQKILK